MFRDDRHLANDHNAEIWEVLVIQRECKRWYSPARDSRILSARLAQFNS